MNSWPTCSILWWRSLVATLALGTLLAPGLFWAQAGPTEPLGPSSRRTQVAISEIMYKPAERPDGLDTEFIELYNSNPWPEDIGNWRLAGQVRFTFPARTSIPANGFLVVAAAPADLQAAYGLAGVFGPYTNRLKSSGVIELLDEAGALLLEIDYTDDPPWPAAAGGAGHSLVLARPSYGEADPRAWEASEIVGGSPRAAEVYRPSPLRSVLINEILAHTDPPDIDSIELYNHSNAEVDLSGCVLTDDAATNRFVFPVNTLIAPRGFVVLTEANLGFALDAAGETIYFKNPDGSRVLDALKFGAQENGVAFGRYPDGAADWYRLSAKTFGTNNAPPRVCDVGINEIMYHPLLGSDDDQYVELFNHGTNAVNLGGWKFVAGISYAFPSNTVIQPGSYIVVAANVNRLLGKYPQLNLTNTFGNFGGRLSGKGERLALAMPDEIVSTNSAGTRIVQQIAIVVDETTYGTGGRWGQWSDGGGSSLELIDPRANKRLAANWSDSDETAKAPWTTIETTGVLDNGANYTSTIGYAQLGLLDTGECLIDDVEVRPGATGANYATNPGLDQGMTGWSVQGDHSRSTLEANGGYPAGGPALHLRGSDRMWTGVNSAQVALTNTTLASGQTATLRFKARWLRGWPEVLMRLNGNWLEATGRLALPPNPGTPGLPNSRLSSNPGPAIFNVTHTPAIPAAGQSVVVTARVEDPDGTASLKLRYRVDPSLTYSEKALLDDGTGGDEVAGDGVFSATIPGMATGAQVAFVVVASDSAGASSRFPALLNNYAPDLECVVRFGDANPSSKFGAYHLWLTQTNVNRWVALPVLSNENVDGTLVVGSRVIYNMGAHYAGSPYHQAFDSPYGNPCHYNWTVPKDDLYLGSSSFNKIHWPGNDIQNDTPTQNINDATIQRGQAAHGLLRSLGIPWVSRRYVAVYVNGRRRGTLMEDALRPSTSVGEKYFTGDSGGMLYKIQPWFEFGPFPSGNTIAWGNKAWATLLPYTTTGGAYKQARYRWHYQMRDTPDSLNNYTNVFTLITAASASSSPYYATALQNLVDMENWMRVTAANHAAGDWDCFGVQNGQNVYAYVSPHEKWKMFMFDMDIALGNPICWSPGANMQGFYGSDANWTRIYATPVFNRMYWRALKELVNGAMVATNFNPLLDAKYAAFVAEALSVQSPAAIESWVAQARTSIISQVAAKDTASVTLSSTNLSAVSNAVTLAGSAPLEVTSICVNGQSWTPTWTSITGWTLVIPAAAGTNGWSVIALDRYGNPVGTTNEIQVVNSTTPDQPAGNIVFNEIMFNPVLPDAQYVELFNRSATTPFDLSGWQVNGLGYTFPPGSSLAPRGYLVLAKSRIAFAATYGPLVPVFDEFQGGLQLDGETLSLIADGEVIDRVRYEPSQPWPATAALQRGTALQVIDPGQDNSRAGNWAVGNPSPPPVVPQWTYYSVTGTATSSRLYIFLASAGDIYVDDLKLVAGEVPDAGANLVNNGGFETDLAGSWTLTANFTQSAVSTAKKHSGNSSLHVVATAAGSGTGNAIYQDISPALTSGGTYTLSFWYLQSTNGGPLVVRLSYSTASSGLFASVNPAPPGALATGLLSPGTINTVNGTLPPFPTLWLNEVQPVNLTGPADDFGERDPWIELYNPGTTTQSLNGLYLGNNYTNAALWAFPTNCSLAPGQFLTVWCDSQPQQNTGSVLHASFRPPPGNGSVVLSRYVSNAVQVVDYLNYSALPDNYSYGDVPDGQPFYRQAMFRATAGGTNNAMLPPVTVAINEWMADNGGYLLDPATSKFEDWFELYNPSDTPAELAGYYLTDDLTDPFQYQIPDGFQIPPRGFLLVWADGASSANATNSLDLHVPFRLNKDGEAIGLYAPDGVAIDAVAFSAQSANVSEGRFPDGGTLRLMMPTPTPRAPNALPPAPAPPALTGFTLQAEGAVEIVFQTAPGHTYRVEFKPDLNAATWIPLVDTLFATGEQTTYTDSEASVSQRFYRVVQLD